MSDPGLKIYTDKLVYAVGEKIWFSAILTKATVADTAVSYRVLYLSLINSKDKSVINSSRYVIEYGCSSGSFEIPDSAGGKELILLGYTNNLTRDPSEKPFIQAISVNIPLRHVAYEQTKSQPNSTVKLHTKLLCDSLNYNRRSKVTCRLKIRDSLNNPLKGIFSFSCARDRVVPIIVDNYNDNNSLFLEDTIRTQIDNKLSGLWFPNKGVVQLFGKPVKKRQKLVYNHNGRMKIIETAANGEFELSFQEFLGNDTTIAYFSPIGNIAYNDMRIMLPHDEDRLNNLIARLPGLIMQPVLTQMPKEVVDSKFLAENSKQLKEVKILGKNLSDHRYSSLVVDTGCETMVCTNRIINCGCSNPHTPAIKGQYYYKMLSPDGRTGGMTTVKYIGCNGVTTKRSKEVRLIQLPEPYIGLDSVSISSPESFKSTTVFWSPLIVTDDNGEAEVTFYTNDLPGNFICTVRGLSTLGEFKAQTMFTVKME